MHWDRAGAERTIPAAAAYGMDFIEIALLNTKIVDAAHTRALLDRHGMRAVCSLGLPQAKWAAEALSGVTYGGIGERTGVPPTPGEYDNIARALAAAAKHAKSKGLLLGIEPVNRYENHLLNTGWQARDLIEKVGADNIFIHLDTYHMNIEEKGAALAAIGFKGGLAMESFINMMPEIAYGLAVWRPVANSFEEVMDKGLPFLRNKASQYRLT
ncbi:MAG: sugar phosphate isomerase/epimerase [Rhodobacteraceae bacterium]|nr:sugar phosphate isomerase/epimerase [Paracoccaceae bacterium]